eukprot:gnl/Dysnectes_brevis/1137_a1269_3286.p1 GENE.gnl/Dysnectes_brevis/1137_a1269_3286~~gnl/Dysnectes_brevis/1137_a1269_3286.p1  ORF type:complete len:529 (-),score=202.58 gnl/Dysnectes_brevis/1137_a1269_3286:102-1688(-)
MSTLQTADGIHKVTGRGDAMHSFSQEERKAFASFINNELGHDPELQTILPLSIDDDSLFKCMADGILFAKLINFAVANTIDERQLSKKKLNPWLINANLQMCISSARAIGCTIVNVGPQDLIEGRPHIVLGMLWQVIKIALMSSITLKDHPELYRLLDEGEDIEVFKRLPPEHILLRWFNYHLKRAKHPRRVHNFSGDLKDGENYTILLSQIAPEKCDRSPLSATGLKRADMILSAAERIGVDRFIQPSDITDGIHKLNLAFTAELFNHCPALEELEAEEVAELLEVDEEDMSQSREARAYRNWINNCGIDDVNINSIFEDLRDGLVLAKLLDKLEPGCINWSRMTDPCRMVFHKNLNCDQIVAVAKKDPFKFSLPGIGGVDIQRGNPKLTMGLCWQAMYYSMMDVLSDLSKKTGREMTEKDVLAWANQFVKDAGKSISIPSFHEPDQMWLFLAELLHAIEPRVIDHAELITDKTDDESRLMNAKYVITAARRCAINVFAVPEDVMESSKRLMVQFMASTMASVLAKK